MDIEAESILKCTELLSKLDYNARHRVINYLLNRFQNQLDVISEATPEIEKGIDDFLVANREFAKTIILLHYPFSYEELLSLKSKLAPGGIKVGTYIQKEEGEEFDEDFFDEDGEYYDEYAFEFEYGLIFNQSINWTDLRIQELMYVPLCTFETRSDGDVSPIKFNMPLSVVELKEFEIKILNLACSVDYQVSSYDENYFLEQEISRLGLSDYETNEFGEIINPPELAKSIKEFSKETRTPVNDYYVKKLKEIENKYKVENFKELTTYQLQDLSKKDDHYLFLNKTIWENTFRKIVTKDKLNKYLGL